ncbi:MAG: hypothetical protein ACI9D5_002948 [Candidatus Endobugula sp.]|jgi:hypothetical protein
MDIRNINWKDIIKIRHQVLWPDKEINFCNVTDDEFAIHFGVYVKNVLVSVASLFIDKSNI